MNKFAVVIPYFGKFKPSISLFLESCARNPELDWLVFTDCDAPENVKVSSNVIWRTFTLEDVRLLAEKKLGCTVNLNRAYKLCDIKPMYGLIFSDYITGYDYWGFGDTDVIYGDVFSFLQTIEYDKYDKINWMGHLCFMRNDPRINRLAVTTYPGTVDPKDVLKNENNIGYDERDYNKKFLSCGLKLYNDKWAADIDIFYQRMRCVDLKTYHQLIDTNEIEYAPKNYAHQVFALIDGRVYRVYIKGKKVLKEEFAYIHFRKEVPVKFTDTNRKTFIISRSGFYPADEKDFGNYDSVKSIICKYNEQSTPAKEILTFLYQYYRKNSGKRGW